MWGGMITKLVQGLLFRKLRHEMMGVPVEYDDEVKRRNMHPMLLPKIKTERLTIPKTNYLRKLLCWSLQSRKLLLRRYQGRKYHRVVIASRFHQELAQRQNEGVCWERRNMDPGLNPSGRLVGPIIRTYTRHFWRSPREPEEQSY